MAEAVLARGLHGKSSHKVESAGIGALVNASADPIAMELMQLRGVDISSHRARQLTPEMGREFDLILVMESGQKRWIEQRIPELRGRVYTMGHWSDMDIPDPYRKPREHFEQALELIDQGAHDWIQRLP